MNIPDKTCNIIHLEHRFSAACFGLKSEATRRSTSNVWGQHAVDVVVGVSISGNEDRVITSGGYQWCAGSISLGVAVLFCVCLRVARWPLATRYGNAMGVKHSNRSVSTGVRPFPVLSVAASTQGDNRDDVCNAALASSEFAYS